MKGESLVDFSDTVEIIQTQYKTANEYLNHGYALLAIQSVSGSGLHGDGKTYFVRRQTVYVLGRPAGVEHYQPGDDEK